MVGGAAVDVAMTSTNLDVLVVGGGAASLLDADWTPP
jgi:hypothetical protein